MERKIKTAIDEFQEQERLNSPLRMEEQLRKIAESSQKQADAAMEQANAAKEQAELALQKAELAKADAKKSKFNLYIAIIAVIISVLAWLVPRETVFNVFGAFLQLLCTNHGSVG